MFGWFRKTPPPVARIPASEDLNEELLNGLSGFDEWLNTYQAGTLMIDYELATKPTPEIAKMWYEHYRKKFKPIKFNPAIRFAGTWIVAPPGRGKTNLLHNMIAEDLKQHCTIVLMDSKGDLINGYKGFGDVVIIDPHTANINPLQLGSSTRSVEFLEYIFSALLETGMTALQKTLFRSVLTLLLKVPNATLETFREVLTHGIEPYTQYLNDCDPATRDFFSVGKPTEFNSATYKETKQQILWRLRLILSNEYLRAIFTSPTTNVPFNELLDSGKVIIIDNSKDDLGEDGAEFFGRFFVALVWMAAVSRSRLRPEQKVPVYFYIDECHSVIKRDTKITTILDECRSQKIALVLAHQRVAQIEPNVIDALNNCAIRIANSDDDAESLAKRFRVEAPALRLPVGQFACFVRDKTAQAVTINVPLFDTRHFPPPPETAPPHPPQPTTAQPRPRAVPTDEVEDF
jgi:type IV secretory pathway VirB4 component